jgi:hypothetical protein
MPAHGDSGRLLRAHRCLDQVTLQSCVDGIERPPLGCEKTKLQVAAGGIVGG